MVLWVGAGGFLGTVLRYGLGRLLSGMTVWGVPMGTFAVNAIGCLVMGCLMSWIERAESVPPWAMVVSVGVLGGFTTFSAFGWETWVLLRDQAYVSAVFNVFANMVLAIGAVSVGFWFGKWGI